MGVTRSVAIVEDPRYRDHRAPPHHPECPERLLPVAEAIAERAAELARIAPRPASDEEILRIHGRDHLARVAAAAREAPTRLDPDTYVSDQSLAVARLAAGGTIDLARAVARGGAQAGFAAIRPPGHHAEPSRAMGFCLFNNAAVAARALQVEERVERILLIDWDVHHGNGTQHAFEEDPSILYFSTHQYPFYPGTGGAAEAGRGRGVGATVNVPLPAGCGDLEYVGVFRRLLVPLALSFRPELVLLSCGFDVHQSDPLASMEVSGRGLEAMARIVRGVADELCEGRIVAVLEGGYSAEGLRQGTSALLAALLDPEPASLPGAPDAPPGSTLRRVVDQVVEVHASHHPGLGAA